MPRPASTTWPNARGVAKGTIYLYFKDKESLFQELLREQISPVIVMLEALLSGNVKGPAPTISLRQVAHRVAELFVDQVLGTRRKDMIRLILTEGPRFPKLAEFYYREVISRGMAAVRGRMQRAVKDGELRERRARALSATDRGAGTGRDYVEVDVR